MKDGVTKMCVTDGGKAERWCETKMLCLTKLGWKMVWDKVVGERWNVTKIGVADGVRFERWWVTKMLYVRKILSGSKLYMKDGIWQKWYGTKNIYEKWYLKKEEADEEEIEDRDLGKYGDKKIENNW